MGEQSWTVLWGVVGGVKDLWLGFLVPAIPALWLAYSKWRDWRSTDRKHQVGERSEREARDAARESARLESIATQDAVVRAGVEALLQRQRQENIDLRAEYERLDAQHLVVCRDRDRGWALARYWHRRAHDMAHDVRNLWTVVERTVPAAGLPMPIQPNFVLPDHLEDPP